ncbi:MAG TPA: nucleotide exchange factor GrpE, partial [Armatimonadota bacterium]|nr:nucleotide exchange factor GrpE [Armatimonadota bacterium]
MQDDEGGLEPETEALPLTVDELQDEIERLRSELDKARRRADDEHDQHLRALADFANYRRRQQEESKQSRLLATQDLVSRILPVVDNFERALEAAERTNSFESLVEGVKLTLRQLKQLMEQEGVQPIPAVGQEFDPAIHEAVMRVETNEYPENTIVEELQTGYTQHNKVIRPARVK